MQFWANVALKYVFFLPRLPLYLFIFRINVKLGGINVIPDPTQVTILSDPRNPTVVMGADVRVSLRSLCTVLTPNPGDASRVQLLFVLFSCSLTFIQCRDQRPSLLCCGSLKRGFQRR